MYSHDIAEVPEPSKCTEQRTVSHSECVNEERAEFLGNTYFPVTCLVLACRSVMKNMLMHPSVLMSSTMESSFNAGFHFLRLLEFCLQFVSSII